MGQPKPKSFEDWEHNFPDKDYLEELAQHSLSQFQERFADTPLRRIAALKGAFNNWMAHWLGDLSVHWQYIENFCINRLYLMGEHPYWRPHIEDSLRQPAGLRELLVQNPEVRAQFECSTPSFDDVPILVCFRNKRYEVFDGMHRTVAAILESRETIKAYVAYLPKETAGNLKPQAEKHLIGEFLNPILRGAVTDSMEQDVQFAISGLKYLVKCYPNLYKGLSDWKIGDDISTEKKELAFKVIDKVLQK